MGRPLRPQKTKNARQAFTPSGLHLRAWTILRNVAMRSVILLRNIISTLNGTWMTRVSDQRSLVWRCRWARTNPPLHSLPSPAGWRSP